MTMLITCQAVGRAFRFVPTERVVALLFFILAYAVSRFAVDVHEFCWMSNHFHIVLTTRDHRLPAFVQTLNSMTSRALNALRGWSGSNIERGYSIVVETDADAVLEHCAYTLANPCAAHLVVRARQWRGVTSVGMKYGETVFVPRPRFGLWGERVLRAMRSLGRRTHAGRTRTPEGVGFVLVRPPIMAGSSDAAVREEVLRRLAVRESNAEAERVESGRRVLGMRRVLAQHWSDIPKARDELFGPAPKAAGRPWAVAEAVRRSVRFQREYRRALQLWVAGDRTVEFPAGTYLMRERFGVRCAAAP
jgi:REP element-mobilizing transposase RayT